MSGIELITVQSLRGQKIDSAVQHQGVLCFMRWAVCTKSNTYFMCRKQWYMQ